MATPKNANWHEALHSFDANLITADISARFSRTSTILDVGAGWGKYGQLLREYSLDACEIWEPYVYDNNLWSLYETVYVQDICDLNFEWYDVVIFGDVLEHIERSRAVALLTDIYSKAGEIYVGLPFEYPQGEVDGNPYEEHKQDDLTPELMGQEYPMLELMGTDGKKAVYVKNELW